MERFRKTSVIEVIAVEENGMLVQDVGKPEDQWLIPTETFNATYVPDERQVDHDLENRFSYHRPRDGQPELYGLIRDTAKDFAYLMTEKCPKSRELSCALTRLEEAVMWANAAIARN